MRNIWSIDDRKGLAQKFLDPSPIRQHHRPHAQRFKDPGHQPTKTCNRQFPHLDFNGLARSPGGLAQETRFR